MNNKNRVARLTSSNAVKLIPMGSRPMTEEELKVFKKANPGSRKKNTNCPLLFQQPALTYIEEKQIEKRIQSCLDADGAYSQAMAWGNFMEMIVFSVLGVEYVPKHKETFLHPKYGKFWSGSVDMLKCKGETTIAVSELKAYQKKKFAQYTDCITRKVTKTFTIQDKLLHFKKDFPQEYWQIVSNAAIHGVKFGEAITFMPYRSAYDEIVELANNYEGADMWKYRFITEKPVEELPFLPNNGYYKDLNVFNFEIPAADTNYLTDRVLLANKILNPKMKVD